MGLFDKNIEKSANNNYEEIKKYLKPKDNRKHIIMINTMSKSVTNGWECENKYTLQIDTIMENMQNDGYEIIDIKIDSTNQSVENMFLIRTLIIYK